MKPWWVCDKNLNVNSQLTWVESITCYDTGCEAQGILPPRLLLAEHTNDLCQSFVLKEIWEVLDKVS